MRIPRYVFTIHCKKKSRLLISFLPSVALCIPSFVFSRQFVFNLIYFLSSFPCSIFSFSCDSAFRLWHMVCCNTSGCGKTEGRGGIGKGVVGEGTRAQTNGLSSTKEHYASRVDV